MSKQDQYLKLWQQKRDEMQVEIDPQADWLNMHQLLDAQMPTHTEPGNASSDGGAKGAENLSNNAGGTNAGSQLSHFMQFKLLYIAAALLTTVVITYSVLRHRVANKNKKPVKTEFKKDSVLNDSVSNPVREDSTLLNDLLIDSSTNKEAIIIDRTNDSISISENGRSRTNKTPLAGNINKLVTGNNSADSKAVTNSRSGNLAPTLSTQRAVAGTSQSQSLPTAVNKINNGVFNKNNYQSRHGLPNDRNRQLGNAKRKPTDNLLSGRAPNLPMAELLNNKAANNNTTSGNPFENDIRLLPLPLLPLVFSGNDQVLLNNYTNAVMPVLARASGRMINAKKNSPKTKDAKPAKIRAETYWGLDWGVLFGVNSQGSFTPANQNKNIYGSLPVDAFTGLFATYHISNKWGVDAQIKLLVPDKISGNYNHTFATRNDTGKIVKQAYKISDTRKAYSAQMPLHLVYNITPNISLKAGPVITLPIKHFGASSFTASGDTIVDSIGYASRLADTISKVTFKKKLSVGISGGVGFSYKRLRLEAVYYYGSPYNVSTPLGSYSPKVSNLQITLGFKLNKPKP